MWGFFPAYFKALQVVPALQIVFHRVVWSFLLLALLITLKKEWPRWRAEASDPRTLGIYLVAACLLAANWLIYVWAVNNGHVVESSLGYFVNPLVNVALGVVLLRERLRPLQWLPVGLAAAGVFYLTVRFGSLPWIALGLAFTFGFYGLLKKVAPLGAVNGLTLETGILFLPSLGYLLFVEVQGSGSFGHIGGFGTPLLAMTGVITSVPLLMFAYAARNIPLSLLGILQYIAPTCQFLLGVLLYKEAFDLPRLLGFSLIWLALMIFTVEGLVQLRTAALAGAVPRRNEDGL
jgi:chloramphenicol-sensitive protein RarD